MNKALKQLTNIGVPCYNEIGLYLHSLTSNCADDKSTSIGIEKNIKTKMVERVDDLIDNKVITTAKPVIDTINFYADDKSISTFDLTKEERYTKIFSPLVDLEKTEKSEKISKTKESLKKLKERLDYIRKNPYSTEFHDSLKNNFNNLYYGRIYGYDLRKYLEEEYNHYKEKYDKKKDIINVDYSDLIEEYTDSLIPEKVALFIADTYINEIYKSIITNDTIRIQECLFYLTAFLKNKIDKNIKIFRNKEITYDSIKQEYEGILIRYPELRELTYKRSFFENKDKQDNLNVINSLLTMKKVYVKESFVKKGEELDIKVKDGSHRRRNTPPTEEELQEIQDYLNYKYYTFLKHNPIAQIECPNKFSNYIAFLYENGYMPADRFHNVNTIEQMKADSIYVFDALTYEEMMQYNKPYLRQHMDIKPLNHSGDWEGRVEHIATQDTSQEMKDKAKQIVKNKTN